MKTPKRVFDEPVREFRSQRHHWRFWPRAGVLRRYWLRNDPDGCTLLVGSQEFELDLQALRRDRPDIFGLLKIMVEAIQ